MHESCTSRAATVARWFDLAEESGAPAPPWVPPVALPKAGEIVLVTGASGAGKSSALRATLAAAHAAGAWAVDLDRLRLAEAPVIDVVADALQDVASGASAGECPEDGAAEVTAALGLLGQVGLAEARTCLLRPSQLSDGQRWRLRLAVGLAVAGWRRPGAKPQAAAGESRAILFADEFAAVLDRVTAAVVARALRRAVDRSDAPLAAVVATSHDDLIPALRPDAIARCDFAAGAVAKSASRRRAG